MVFIFFRTIMRNLLIEADQVPFLLNTIQSLQKQQPRPQTRNTSKSIENSKLQSPLAKLVPFSGPPLDDLISSILRKLQAKSKLFLHSCTIKCHRRPYSNKMRSRSQTCMRRIIRENMRQMAMPRVKAKRKGSVSYLNKLDNAEKLRNDYYHSK